jgi:hypothetical protein
MLASPPILAEQLTMAGPSALVLSALLLLLGVSAGAFSLLVWRETSARRSVALAEWARASGFYHNPLARLRPPAPLDQFGRGVRVRACYVSTRAAVVDFVADRPPAASVSPPTDPAGTATVRPNGRVRHALVWPVQADWPTVGLRPTGAVDSLVDLLPVPAQPARFGTERFVVYAGDRRAADAVAASHLRGLLPADIGLILAGKHLVLDFSDRPFDGIEFNRMIAVAEQMVAHLPVVR